MRYKLLFLVGMILAVSCNDKNDKLISQLEGTWTIVGATRNNKSTKTLDGGIISFTPLTLTTDITGEQVEAEYDIKKDQIITSGSTLDFVIDDIQNDNLVLSANLRSTDFVFIFKKNNESL